MQSVADISRDDTPTYLINPLPKKTLEFQEFNDNNEAILYVIPPMEVMTYPKWLADILRKHLVDAIINERGMGYVSEEKRAEIALETEAKVNG